FRAIVATAFEDEFTARQFGGAEKVFIRKSALSYKCAMALKERIANVNGSIARRLFELAVILADFLASSVHCFSLALLILKERVAVVHSNNSVEAVVAGLITKRPVVYHLHGVTPRRLR